MATGRADVVVIGSGIGGMCAAARLTAMGKKGHRGGEIPLPGRALLAPGARGLSGYNWGPDDPYGSR